MNRDGAFYVPALFPALQRGEGFLDPFGFVEGAQATGANLDLDRLAVAHQGLLVDVGLEPGLGVAVGVAHIIAGHPGF